MKTLILDLDLAERLRRERADRDIDHWDEVWDGTYVIVSPKDNEHQEIVSRLSAAIMAGLPQRDSRHAYPGINVSDRESDWEMNYRIPDVAVYLPDSLSVNRDSHWYGGPDFAVEVVSPGDRSRKKLDFYASIGTKELLIIDRNPCTLELWRLTEGELRCVGSARIDEGELSSSVIPFGFALEQGTKRTRIKVRQISDGRTWIA